jgi:hypothetical protein
MLSRLLGCWQLLAALCALQLGLSSSEEQLGSATQASIGKCDCPAENYLSSVDDFPRNDQPKHVPGMHVVCVKLTEGMIDFQGWPHGVKGDPVKWSIPNDPKGRKARFKKSMKTHLKISKKNKQNNLWGHYDLKQSWAMFTPDGVRLETVKEILNHPVILVMEGGQFIWPGVRIGHKQQKAVGNKVIELETLSLQPLVLSVRNFLEPHECDEIISLGKGRMKSSDVSRMDHDK